MSRLALLASITWLSSCGGGGGSDYAPSPSPSPPPSAVTWDQVKTIVAANCVKCHDGTKEPLLTPESAFRASPVKAKLTASAMPPPPNVLADADKQALLSFLAQ
jgi:hypothetical protein